MKTSIRYFWFAILLITISLQVFAQENPHKKLTFDCAVCHTTSSWTEVRFDHNQTDFFLEAQHANLACKECHDLENFQLQSSDCAACHADVHQAKLGNDCERCHKSSGWEIFDVEEIHLDTQFPIMGRHSLVDCWSCHKNTMQGDFAVLSADCNSCHEQEYLATTNPEHVNNAFPTQCLECHEMNAWQPGFLPNHDIFFPIFSGEHNGVWGDCSECHDNPAIFNDFTCLTCHDHRQSEMDAKHQGITGYAYISSDCLFCHPQGEKGEFKEHDSQFFPIYSGEHAGEWEACLECHDNPADRAQFTCLACHDHRQSEMDAKHQGMPGYVYDSADCLFCHPRGEKGDFEEHDTLYFPIYTGDHRGEWGACSECHTNSKNAQEFSCLTCHEHSKTEMDDEHKDENQYVYDSAACYDCHPNGKS